MAKSFIKNKEDFICEHCGHKVKGTGYTNHCPKCFYSKHVDINPGDRENNCQALMEPIRMSIKNKEWRVVHRCLKCRALKENRVDAADDIEVLAQIIKNNI